MSGTRHPVTERVKVREWRCPEHGVWRLRDGELFVNNQGVCTLTFGCTLETQPLVLASEQIAATREECARMVETLIEIPRGVGHCGHGCYDEAQDGLVRLAAAIRRGDDDGIT